MLDRLLDALASLPVVPTYLVLMALSALENVFPPVPADTAVALGAFLARRGEVSVVPLVALCWLANLASAAGTYLIGRRIDDLATTGGSKFEAIEKLTGVGLIVKDVVVLVDRQSGAGESLAQAGYAMHAVLTIGPLLDYWESNGKVEKDKIEQTRKFLSQA